MDSGLWLLFLILLGLPAAGAIGYCVSLYNSLIQVRNNIAKAWSNIDVLLLQRNTEIPKLIDAAGAYVRYETHLLESIMKLRTIYGAAKRTDRKTRIENRLDEKIRGLKAVWEGYPQLKSNEPFLRLQRRISGLETSISDRRTFFNETVTIYNTQRDVFPQVVLARLLGFRPHPLLDIPKKK